MAHPKEEKTLIILKPDAVHRGVMGEVIARFERKGLKVVGMKMIQLKDAMLDAHYAHIADKPFFGGIKKFMQTSPVVVMALSGVGAVDATRLIVGPTKGYEAPAGTIRGDFSLSTQSNLVHASDSVENGAVEVARFFTEDELFDYKRNDFDFINAEEVF
ncbi:MAG: nucleoside-diphosphate kinase [Parcubacteria group bacterium 21-54-25]|nr:MAG: nucleoside-diphosphate kinase [Parcubacteria group bacterium 21-54-25]HQU08247.1 nucleoside-diphosphate kinase [Candidatus Paceibacterota bacterium]